MDGRSSPDLNTSQPYVRSKIAGLVSKLRSLGATGLRIDAAKHMPPSDIAAILGSATAVAYDDIVQETIVDWNAPAKLNPGAYVGNGRVTDFSYAWNIAERLGGRYDGMHGLKWILRCVAKASSAGAHQSSTILDPLLEED